MNDGKGKLEIESILRRYGLLQTISTGGDQTANLAEDASRARTSEYEELAKLENASTLLTRIQEENERLRGRIKALEPEIENWNMIADFWKKKYEEKKASLDRFMRSVSEAVQMASDETIRGPQIAHSPEGDLRTIGSLSLNDSLGARMEEMNRQIVSSGLSGISSQR
jgi:chromosome segregation ATPase